MPLPKHFRKFTCAIALFGAASFCGCSRQDAALRAQRAANAPASGDTNLAEPPLEQQTEQKLDPLTKDDVELYLKVMRAAAERVKHLSPADQAALDGAKKILAASASGRVPTRDDVKTLDRANLVAVSMDQIIADEMKLDGRAYRGIAEAIESAVPISTPGTDPGHVAPTGSDRAPTPLEKRIHDVNATNDKFLAPYHDEIQQLVDVVRNPANLPK